MKKLPLNTILYENKDVLVLNKIPGIPSVSDLSGDLSMQELAEDYFQQQLFPVNRLDRPASGALILCRNATSTAYLNLLLKEKKIWKYYLAVTENEPPKEKGTLEGWISLDKKYNKAHFKLTDPGRGKRALSHYNLLDKSDNYFLLGIELITGRQHQIRAQLSFLNCPVKGDVKYGARRKNKDRSIHLHAFSIEFSLPDNGELLRIYAPLPEENLWQFFQEPAMKFFNAKN